MVLTLHCTFIDLAEFPDIMLLMVRPHYDPISVPNILPKASTCIIV